MASPTLTSLFDANGRLIPEPGEMVYSQVDRRYFRLAQPPLDFARIHARTAAHLAAPVDAAAFQDRCEALRTKICADKALAGLFFGVAIPFVLPPGAADADLGAEVEGPLLGAVAGAFAEAFPKYAFHNHVVHPLAGQMALVPGTRYERLLAARAAGPVVGWYFPVCMAGFAVPQTRDVLARLPEQAILSGPLEAACALVGTPELLFHETHYPNLLALGAVTPPDEDFFYNFEAYGWNLTFNERSMVGAVAEYFAGGLTIIDAP